MHSIQKYLLMGILIVLQSLMLLWADISITAISAVWAFNDQGSAFGGNYNCSISATGNFSLSSSSSSSPTLTGGAGFTDDRSTCQVATDCYYYSTQASTSVTITASLTTGVNTGPVSGDKTVVTVTSLDGAPITSSTLTNQSKTMTFSLPPGGAIVSIDPVSIDTLSTSSLVSTMTFYPDVPPVPSSNPTMSPSTSPSQSDNNNSTPLNLVYGTFTDGSGMDKCTVNVDQSGEQNIAFSGATQSDTVNATVTNGTTTCTFPQLLDGIRTIVLTAYDNLGSTSQYSFTTYIDNTVFSATNTQGWANGTTGSIQASISNSTQDISVNNFTYSINGGPSQNGTWSTIPYSVLPSGDQSVTLSVNDGYQNLTFTVEAKVDNTAPQFGGTPLTVVLAPPSHDLTGKPTGSISSMAVTWPSATDAQSGLSSPPYQVSCESTNFSEPTASTNATISLSSLSRTSDNTVVVGVTATDVVGNVSPMITTSLVLPKLPSVTTSTPSPALNTDGSATVLLSLGITASEFGTNYASIVIQRQSGDPANPLPAGITTSIVITPSGETGENLQDATRWTTDANGLVFKDTIQGSIPGWGGRSLSYKIYETPLNQTVEEFWSTAPTVTLPHHPGVIPATATGATYPNQINVLDMQGTALSFTNSNTISTSMVQIQFQGQGVDQDDWNVEVDEAQAYSGSSTGGTGASLTTYNPIGTLNSYPYSSTSATEYPLRAITVNLYAGSNNICIRWTQGTDSATRYVSTLVLTLNLVYNSSSGNYTLTITSDGNGVPTSSAGLVVQPFQQITFTGAPASSGATGGNYTWSFGDPHSTVIGPPSQSTVVFSYPQKTSQVTDNYVAPFVLTCPEDPTVTIPITVQDTQTGTLCGPEIWNGPHTVIGTVVVPSGMTLTIGSIPSAATTVTFHQAGLTSETGLGLSVQGGLVVGPSSVAFAPDSTTPGWGTILVSGPGSGATISNATLQNADRGITSGPGSTVSIVKTTFQANTMGLQVYGNTSTTVNHCTFTGNTAYGVKEDAGGRPVMTNNTFSTNTIDYYAFGQFERCTCGESLRHFEHGGSQQTSQQYFD